MAAIASQEFLVLGQRMAGEVEVEHFLLVLELVGFRPRRHVRQRFVRFGDGGSRFLGGEGVEQVALAEALIVLPIRRRLNGAGQGLHQLRAVAAETIERPALMSRSIVALD